MTIPAIEFKEVSYAYAERPILRDLSFVIEAGTTAAVIGASGAGKTTVLKLIAGLLTPTAGAILIDGRNLQHFSEKGLARFRQNLGYLFQQGALFTDLTVFDNVAFPLREEKNLTPQTVEKRVTAALAAVGLTNAATQYPAELSGGMVKRAALARALILRPAFMLYDEPFAGLDPVNLNNIARLLAEFKEKNSMTAVMVTHAIYESLFLSDQIIFLADGHALFSGTPAAFQASRDKAIAAFLPPREWGSLVKRKS